MLATSQYGCEMHILCTFHFHLQLWLGKASGWGGVVLVQRKQRSHSRFPRAGLLFGGVRFCSRVWNQVKWNLSCHYLFSVIDKKKFKCNFGMCCSHLCFIAQITGKLPCSTRHLCSRPKVLWNCHYQNRLNRNIFVMFQLWHYRYSTDMNATFPLEIKRNIFDIKLSNEEYKPHDNWIWFVYASWNTTTTIQLQYNTSLMSS